MNYGTIPGWMPRWMARRAPIVSALVTFANLYRRARVLWLLTAAAVGAVAWIATLPAAARALTFAAEHFVMTFFVGAIHASISVSRRKPRACANHENSWTAPLPLRVPAPVRLAFALVVQLLVLALLSAAIAVFARLPWSAAGVASVALVSSHSLKSAPREAKRKLGFACAPDRLPGLLTGRQCLEIYAAAKDLTHIDADVLTLADEFRYTEMLDLFVDSYSLGTRQKLAVLLSLLGEPDIILLDEAFNGLDPASSLVLKRHLRTRVSDGRCGVLLATHALDIVERYADRAALLLEGKLAHQWQRAEIAALASASEGGFEAAIATLSSARERVEMGNSPEDWRNTGQGLNAYCPPEE